MVSIVIYSFSKVLHYITILLYTLNRITAIKLKERI